MMEPYRQSEEKILQLGKSLVAELQLENSVDTLGRWMAHYVAGLIESAEQAGNTESGKILKKETFDTILDLWARKEHLPIGQPLVAAKDLAELLRTFQIRSNSALSFFDRYRRTGNRESWPGFISDYKMKNKRIYDLIVNLHLQHPEVKEAFSELQAHKDFLTEEEKGLLLAFESIAPENHVGNTPNVVETLESIEEILNEQLKAFKILKAKLSTK